MSLPHHQNPSNSQDTARAPYNFVPLPEAAVASEALPDHDRYYAQRHTGQIRCTLTTATPLYTRAALERIEYDDFKDSKDKTESFYIDPASKNPVIPGSSLRGMLRTLVEIASFGKLDAVGQTPLVYRAVGDVTGHGDRYRDRLMRNDGSGYNAQGKRCKLYTPLMQAGYMQKLSGNRWQIQPAQTVGGVSFARIDLDALDRLQPKLTALPGCRNAATLHVQPGPYDYQDVRGGFLRVKQSRILRVAEKPGSGLIAASVVRSGHMASKRSEAVIFALDTKAEPIAISDDLYDDYREQLSQEQQKLLGKNGVFSNGQPVFYLREQGTLIFLSHTMMMRLPYEKTPYDFVPAKLRDPQTIDLAEAIFGFVRPEKQAGEQSRAGRVYVSDARLAADQDLSKLWFTEDDSIILKVLGSPKPTTFQHYLTQQEPDPQIEGQTRDGRPKYKKELADYTTAHLDDAVLRGHKLYWHKQDGVSLADIQEDAQTLANAKKSDTQRTRVKPVAAGVRFVFTTRFENLTDAELGALLWALTLPGESGKSYRHKIGMGKPLGLGSVQVQAQLFLSDRQQRYRQLFSEAGSWAEALDEAAGDPFVDAYEKFVLARIHPQERGEAQQLRQLLRIKMLLTLLEWPGPAKQQTRYMEIEREDPNARRGKINEYKSRPVLPDPLAVTQPGGRPSAPRTNQPPQRSPVQPPSPVREDAPQTRPVRVTTSAQDAPTPKAANQELAAQFMAHLTGQAPTPTPTPIEQPATPQALSDVKEGMWLKGTVVRIDLDSVVVDIGVGNARLHKDQVQPGVRDSADLAERFPTGKTIRIWCKGRNKQGKVQLTMKDPRK